MNATNLLDPATIERITLALGHFLWQGAVIAMLAAAVLRFLGQAPAHARYTVAVAGLLLMLAAPAVTFLLAGSTPMPIISFEAPPAVSKLASGQFATPVIVRSIDWQYWVVAIWFLGVVICSVRLTVGWSMTRRLIQASDPATSAIRDVLEKIATQLAIRRGIQVLLSPRLDSPVVTGWLRPTILLPAAALTGLTPEQLRAILAHELAHIRRHDFPVNLLQSAIESLLFYHPAVWWLSSRIRTEREHCCDDLAIEVCGDRVQYARALVELEQSRQDSPAIALAATGGDLAGRVRRILGSDDAQRHWIEPAAVSTIVVVLLMVAASYSSPVNAQAPPPPPPPPPAQGAGRQAPPPPPPAPAQTRSFRMGRSEGPSWVMYRGDSSYMNGSTADEIESRAVRRRISGDFLWFQIGGRAYIVQDKATLDRIANLYAPMDALGEQQRKLGEEQRALGEQQRALGEKMREVRTTLPDMDAEIEEIQRKLRELRSGATQEELGRLQGELGRLQAKIGSLQGQAGHQQSVIGSQQGELGRKQGELGRQQGELGRKQGEIARQAHNQVVEMLRDLVSSGRAKTAP